MNLTLKPLSVLSVALVLPACAAIVQGRHQDIQLATTPERHATCTLTNSKGTWTATETPATVTIRRAYDPISVECNKANVSGLVTEDSKHSNWVWGNLLFGGLVGLGVDHFTASMYNYPEAIDVPIAQSSAR